MRIILFTGKGGVGKTTVSAATALRAAELGYKTLVISTDPAHSLADSLDFPLDSKPVKISKNLSAQEIDTQKELEENWGMIQEHAVSFLEARGVDNVVAEETAIIPGLEELFGLIEIKEYCDKKSYQVLVIDSAPTSSALRLLSFPDIMSWWVKNIFNIQRKGGKVVRPLRSFLPLPDSSVIKTAASVYEKVDGLKEILTKKGKTTVRLVVNPEKMVIKEAQKTYTYLNLFELPVDAVLVNKIIPDKVNDPYFSKWKEAQKRHLTLIKESFEPLPILKFNLADSELIGQRSLIEFSKKIYGSRDPVEVFFKEPPLGFARRKGDFILKVKLPFAEQKNVDLLQRGDELIIRVGSYKRSIALPHSLVGHSPREAKFEKDYLNVYFGDEGRDEKRRKR